MVAPMAISAVTPRDRLQRLVDLGRKTLRYWWLVAVFAVLGAGLSLAFVMMKDRSYQSWSTLFYQERITSPLLSQQREEIAQRNIAEKYGELLVARPQLEQVLADPKLDPYPLIVDPELKIDKLRTAVKLEGRGGSSFRIVFTHGDPDRLRLQVLAAHMQGECADRELALTLGYQNIRKYVRCAHVTVDDLHAL